MNILEQNYYSRWLKNDELINSRGIKSIGKTDTIESTGLPIGNIEDKIIVDSNIDNTILIGSTGSGKTQSVILPMLYQSAISGESLIVNDFKGELYKETANLFEKEGYDVICINLSNPNLGNCWNPFDLPIKKYSSNRDEANKLIESIFDYLTLETNKSADPFWSNSAAQYLTGITKSLLDKKIDVSKINLKTLSKFSTEYNTPEVIDYIEEIDKTSTAYQNIASTYLAPLETKASIMSVVNQKISIYTGKENLLSLISKSDFDILNIRNNKTIIYFTYDVSSLEQKTLYNIFLEQAIYVLNNDNNKKPFNFLLDEFDFNNLPIKNLCDIVDKSRSHYVRFLFCISNFDRLKQIYGLENIELLKYQCANILYLISNESNTLKFISDICGKKNEAEYLVSPEALRRMPIWNCIFIKSRLMPYFGTMIPFYKMGINIDKKEYQMNSLSDVGSLEL